VPRWLAVRNPINGRGYASPAGTPEGKWRFSSPMKLGEMKTREFLYNLPDIGLLAPA
jgi:hypothetical protein